MVLAFPTPVHLPEKRSAANILFTERAAVVSSNLINSKQAL
jgi:hypothetical protein